ncbi:hypothetical protein Tco_0380032, partial [Tanacetum coccineum]
MSDSEDSIVTYTQVSSPFEDSSYVGSPGVDGPPVYGLLGIRMYVRRIVRGGSELMYGPGLLDVSDSPGYVPESDPEEEPEADDDEDPEEDPADYPTDKDDDDDEEEPSKDDADDEEE